MPNQGMSSAYIGNTESQKKYKNVTIHTLSHQQDKANKQNRRKRLKAGDPSDTSSYLGPWAPHVKNDDEEQKLAEEMAKNKEQWERENPAREARKKRKLNNFKAQKGKPDDDDDDDEEQDPIALENKRKEENEAVLFISLCLCVSVCVSVFFFVLFLFLFFLKKQRQDMSTWK